MISISIYMCHHMHPHAYYAISLGVKATIPVSSLGYLAVYFAIV